jgi:hypothetical protein
MISVQARTIVLSAFLGLALVGCESQDGATVSVHSTQYQLIENGCDTGLQEFSSKGDYCAGLKDEVRNHGCAFYMRAQTYRQECGSDWPAYEMAIDSVPSTPITSNSDSSSGE